jgi:hypothetical protein
MTKHVFPIHGKLNGKTKYYFPFTNRLGWLQGRVAHFSHHNLVFCRVACIYLLLTWHKKVIFQFYG